MFDSGKSNLSIYEDIVKQFNELDLGSGEFSHDGILDWDSIKNSINGCNDTAIAYFKTLDDGTGIIDNQAASMKGLTSYIKQSDEAFAAFSKAFTNVLLNVGASLAISAVTQTVLSCVTANDKLAESASKLGSEFESTKSEISDYESQISSLYETINSPSSSIEEVTDARQQLLSLQDEMIAKYGDEAGAVEIITAAINGQTDAVDGLSSSLSKLTSLEWEETLNAFNSNEGLGIFDKIGSAFNNFVHGSQNNAETMLKEMENASIEINVSQWNQDFLKQIKNLSGVTASVNNTSLFDDGTATIQLKGNLNDIYDSLLNIQSVASNLGFDKTVNQVGQLASSSKATLDQYKDFYDNYVLNEQVLPNYADVFNEINTAYDQYLSAFASGNNEEIQNAILNYSSILKEGVDSAFSNGDTSVANYLSDLYPEMESIVAQWTLPLKFEDNTDGLRDQITEILSGLEGMTSEEILGLNMDVATDKQKQSWHELTNLAEEYSVSLEGLLSILEDVGAVNSESYQQLVDLFGADNISKLSPDDLEIAYTIENIGNMTFENLEDKIFQIKKLAETGFDINARTNLNAYNDVKDSDNGGSYRADYDSYTAMMKEAKELYDASRTGNETFKAAAKAFSMNGMDDAKDFAENYAQLNKYFTEDSSGLQQFVTDLSKLTDSEDQKFATWSDDTKSWSINLEHAQEAANQLYMPLEMLNVLMEGLREYGFTNDYFGNMEDGTARLTDLYKQLAEAQSKLDQMYEDDNAEGTEIKAQEDLVKSINNSIDTTKAGIQQLIDSLSSEELNNAYQANKDAIQQLMDEYNKNLEDPSVLGDSFDYVQESLKSAIEQISEEYNIPIKFDVDTNKADFDTTLQDIESRINEYTKILSDYNAGKIQLDDSDVEQAKESLKSAYEEKQQLTAPAIMSVDTSQIDSDVADLITKLQSVVDTSNQIEINKAIGADTSELESDLRSTLANINSTPAEVKAELGLDETNFQTALANINASVQPGVTLNQTDLDTITSTISAITPQMVVQAEVADEKVNEYAAEEKESSGKVIWDNVHDNVDRWIAQNHEASGTVVWKNDTSRVKTTFTATGVVVPQRANGTAHALGTAHANGAVGMALWNHYFSSKPGSAYVKGDWRLPHDENALVGELGAELLVRDGKASLIGVNGAEFKGLKRGDIIFNHKQVEALLKYGYITGRGKPIGFTSHAMGTVNSYAGGSTGSFGGYQTTKASSASSSASTKANTKAVSENTKSVDDLKEKFDSYNDWIAKFIDAFDRQYAQMERMANDLQDSYKQQNSTINQMISLTQKFQANYEKMYDEYMNKAYASGLSPSYQKKIIDGTINIESITDESLKEKISEFEKWYSAAADLQDKIQDLNVTLKDLYNQKLSNIDDDFSRIIDYYDTMTDRYRGIIEMRKTIGMNADGKIIEPFINKEGSASIEAYYNAALSNTITTIDLLYKQYNEMNAELTRMVKNGQIQAYSDDWYEWKTKLQQIYQSIDDAKIQYKELTDELRAYHWEGFNANIEAIDYSIQELKDVMGHLNSDNFVDELGNITEEGDANIALIATVLDKYKQKLADYTTAIKKLDEELENGVINQEQYTEYTREYLDAIRETSNAIDDYKNQLIDLYKQQLEIENETLQKNISLRKEALQKKKDYYDYDKTIRDKNKDINALKAQIAAMEGVTSASGKAELARLKSQLAEAEGDLDSTKMDHQFEMMSTGYDELSDKADEAYDAVLNSLTRSTEEQERVINEMLERIKTSYKDAYSEIAQTITDAGILLSEDTQRAIDSIGTSSGAANTSDKAQTANSDVSSSSTANNVKTSIDSSAKTDKNTVTSISLNKSSATIAVGGSVKLTASVSPAGTTNPVSWSSSNTGVATVSGGTVTGKKAGTAKITATCGMRTATCTITVKATTTSSGGSSSASNSNLKTATNTTDGHNLRDAAGYGGKIITSMPKGSKVTLLGGKKEADGLTWYKVKYGDKTGWTSSYYLKFAKGVKDLKKRVLALTNEEGPEMVISPLSGQVLYPYEDGIMMNLNKGDSVIKKDFADNVMDVGKIGVDGLVAKTVANVKNLTASGGDEYNFGDYKVEIYPTQKLDRQEIRKISDYCYDDWFDRAKNDQRAAGFKHR